MPGVDPGGVPFSVMSLIVGAVLVMAAAGDVRVMRFGMARGGPRLSRHCGECALPCSSRPVVLLAP